MISLIKPSRLLHFFEEELSKSKTNFLVYEYTGDDFVFPTELFLPYIKLETKNFAVIDDCFEGLLTQDDIVEIESIAGLDDFIVISSNAKLKHPKCYYLNIHLYTDYYDSIEVSFTQEFINTDLRNKKYICLNRQERLHRFKIVEYLLNNDLVKHGFVSCPPVSDFINIPKKRYLDQDLKKFSFNNLKLDLPLVIDLDTTVINHPAIAHNLPKLDIHHYDSYFSIITERDFYNSNYLGYTEKILKAILFCQPFIVVGLPHTLQLLKEQGFKTFENFIDESYDSIEDNDLRMKTVCEEIQRLNNMSYTDLDLWYHSMEDIIEHNFDTYKSICTHENFKTHIDKYTSIMLGDNNG